MQSDFDTWFNVEAHGDHASRWVSNFKIELRANRDSGQSKDARCIGSHTIHTSASSMTFARLNIGIMKTGTLMVSAVPMEAVAWIEMTLVLGLKESSGDPSTAAWMSVFKSEFVLPGKSIRAWIDTEAGVPHGVISVPTTIGMAGKLMAGTAGVPTSQFTVPPTPDAVGVHEQD